MVESRSAWRWLTRFLAWWVVLFALWLLFAGQWSWLVAVGGAVLAAVAAVGGCAVTEQGLPAVGRQAGGLSREFASAARAIVVDFGVVIGALVSALITGRRRLGEFREDESTGGAGRSAAGRRAWTGLLASWAPNSYVVDTDANTGRRRVHDLVPHHASELPR